MKKVITLSLVLLLFSFSISGCAPPKDTTPPQVSITLPQNGTEVSGTVTIQALAIDNVGVTKVEFYIDGSKVRDDTTSPYTYDWNTDNLQYGSTHTIQAKAYDNAGNVGVSNVVQVSIGDTQAPQVIITNPQNGQTVSGIVTIQASVVDKVSPLKKIIQKAPSGITKVEFYIDGSKVGEDTESPYEYSWNTDNLQYGSTHTIQAKAYDNAGNVGVSNVVQVSIGDTQAPQVTITNPQDGQTVSGIVTIQAAATDNVGVTKVEFYIDGSKVGEDTESPYEYSWNTDNLQYGSTHTIQAKAYDNAGNVGVSNVVQVSIGDTQAPQVTITNPQNGQTVSGTVTIQVSVVDKVSPAKKTIQKAPSGISKVEFYIDNNKVGEDTESPYTYEWDTTNLTKNSLHVITVKAYDKAGNIGKDEVTVMIGEVSQVVGVIESPAGITPTDFEVVNITGTTEVAEDGTFTLSVVQDFQGVVSAVSKTKDFALFSINLKSYAPFASKLIKGLKQKIQKQGVNIGLAINSQSTAEALVFLNPLFATSDPDKQNIIFPIIANDPKVAELANVISQVASSPDPYSEPAFINAYKDAVDSVYNSLPDEYKVSTKSPKSPVDKKIVVLKYPENGGYIELADLDLTKVNFINNSIKVDFKDTTWGVGVDYIVNIRELDKSQFRTLDDLIAEPHNSWSVFRVNYGGTNVVMRLESNSLAQWGKFIRKIASEVLDHFIDTTEVSIESNKIYEVSLYSGGFGLWKGTNRKNDNLYINGCLNVGDEQPKTYVLKALGFNLFIASFDLYTLFIPIDEITKDLLKDFFETNFMEIIKDQFNWITTDSDPPKDTEILNLVKNIFADSLSELANKAVIKKVIARLLKIIAKWLKGDVDIVDIVDKISTIGTLSHRVYDLINTTPLDRVIVVTGDALPPKAPTNLQIQSVDCNKITLIWQDNSNFERGYKIERKVEGGNYTQIATVSSDTSSITSYTDTGLTPGTTYYYRIKAYNNAGDSDYSNEVSATTLSGQSTIQGNIKDTNNQPIQGATVSVEGTSLQATTDSQGYYQVTNVPAGTRTVTASKTGYNSQSKTVNVVAGQTVTVDFQLQLATGTIQGTVKDTNNQPIQGVTVSVEGTSLQTTTDSQGYYQVTNVPAGTRTVTASKTGYNSQSKTVNVVAGQTITVDFQLEISSQDVVTFADPNLEQAVRDALGIPVGQPITKEKMKELRSLFDTKGSIYNLSGLEYAINLKDLSLWYSPISDISPLANLTNLIYLSLEHNQISDISPLSNLTNLQYLDLMGNYISDISLLSNLTNLIELELDYNQISDISPLSNLTNLQHLELDNNKISDISPLSNLTNLQILGLGYNPISNISPLSNLTNLQSLGLIGNQIIDISPLSNLTNLQGLILWYNQISDISPLSNLSNLQDLYLDYNQISDISPLSNLSNLRILGLRNNHISDISPLVANPGLGQGDEVYLQNNLLDLSEGSDDMKNIQMLQNRGVAVYYW